LLPQLERLLKAKEIEKLKLEQWMNDATTRNVRSNTDWMNQWQTVLSQTESTLKEWQSFLEKQPEAIDADAKDKLNQLIDAVDEQSDVFNHQFLRVAMDAYQPVPIGGHTLPPLPYAYNALEPHIDELTMRIHHDKHHQSYVDGLNKAEREMAEARKKNEFSLIKHWERELAFNGAGHYLHTIFWDNMSPQGGGLPTGALADQINRDFGGHEAFKRQFSQAAEKVEGGGWAILVWSPRSHRLEILQAEKHQNLSQWDIVPLLALDVWEHAYYLKHQNKRADYIQAWWNVVNWPYVQERYLAARQLMWIPY
jgi:superoxide dismutase